MQKVLTPDLTLYKHSFRKKLSRLNESNELRNEVALAT